MPRFSANISTVFCELDFLDRVPAAAKAGFGAVEAQFPYHDASAEEFKAAIDAAGLDLAVFNIDPGDLMGQGGHCALPGGEDAFKAAVAACHAYAEIVKPRNINVLAGWPPAEFERAQCRDVLISNLAWAAEAFADIGVRVVVEAVNDRDRPGFLVTTSADAVDIIDSAGHPNLAMEYDLYHMQIMEGDLIPTMKNILGHIGHIQFADTPGRHEPGTGEINFANVFTALDEMGYDGWLGAEYHPVEHTESSLAWLDPYR